MWLILQPRTNSDLVRMNVIESSSYHHPSLASSFQTLSRGSLPDGYMIQDLENVPAANAATLFDFFALSIL